MTTLPYTAGSQNLNSLNKLVLEQFVAGKNAAATIYDRLAIIQTPTRKDEKFNILTVDATVHEVADGGAFIPRGVEELPANTVTQKIYKDAVTMGDFAKEFDNYGSILEAAMSFGYQYETKIDELVIDFFNNATSTTAPYGVNVGGTTVAMAGTTQAIGATGATQSNRVSGNLDLSTASAAKVLMNKMKDHNGKLGNFTMTRVLVPSEEAINAWQMFRSPGNPETSNNNANYFNSKPMEIIESPRLTSTTACFFMADKSAIGAKGLRLLIKRRPSMTAIRLQDSGVMQYQYSMMLAPGLIDYLGIVSVGL